MPAASRCLALIAAAAALSALAAPVARAGDFEPAFAGFRTPSGNIHCMFDPGDARLAPSVRCDIRDIASPPPPRPRSCDGEWGRSFSVAHADAAGQLLCTGDAVFSDTLPVLDYGETWQQSGFTCLSETTGLTCFNARRHGFTLSKTARTVF